ncbi:mannitol dehydrogenase family protein [Leucobacter sp. CSA1]|uniref:Mannitol-1-phosphate 5-dehydrogenase n=1 Tax=Leucobacter chromiisoli TaxID=2796471 RepID=A0A934Q541_9MICO|nr:mannitol dehydrogenase family protein [Leucobacter chromiisoli]MBK0417523.1 mannitol dehydrogenase family protein [Leucobacter chromiisoli]
MADLRSSTLSIAKDNVVIPLYNRDARTPSIVHIGLGGFSRAHLAMYLDRLLARGADDGRDWSLCGVGLMPGDSAMRDVMEAQDRLYTLVTRASSGDEEARIIGSVSEYLFAPDDPEAVIRRLAAPGTLVVTLTVTEAGYGMSGEGETFDIDRAGARADAEPGALPRTAWGLLAEALRRRRAEGIPPFTVLSCDNIQGNGEVARAALVGFARHVDPGLAGWIDENVAFPNSMVDRITPATTDRDRAAVAELTGLEDRWPVCSERFEQWVVEDRFSPVRPPLDAVGAQFVPDVAPYEKMKLRLLNASHQAMSYLGLLEGFTEVHEACEDPDFSGFVAGYLREEAAPTLDPVPGVDLADYRAALLSRFRNRAIRDTLARQVVDGSSRIPAFLLPVALERAAHGLAVERCALVLAAWQACLLRGARDPGARLVTHDARLAELESAALGDEAEPGSFLDAALAPAAVPDALREAYLTARENLERLGPRGAIRAIAASGADAADGAAA